MWFKISDIHGDTYGLRVFGGWLVSHHFPSDVLSKTVTFLSDPDHLSFPDVPVVTTIPDAAPVADVPVASVLPAPVGGHYVPIYIDGWADGWTHYSWATVDDAAVDGARTGTSVLADTDGYAAFNVAYKNGNTFSRLDTLGVSFQIKAEGDGSQASSMAVSFTDGRTVVGSVDLADKFPAGFPTDAYGNVFVSLEEAGVPLATMCTNILVKGKKTGDRLPVFIDNIQLVRRDKVVALPPVSLDPKPAAAFPFSLSVSGNKILDNGVAWQGRGVNLHDTRGNNACAYSPPNVGEVLRRLDYLSGSGVSVVRLCLESYASAGGRVHWQSVLDDPDYLADVKAIVNHAGVLGLKVILTPWVDPSYSTSVGEVSDGLVQLWRFLASSFIDSGHVIFGILNEPTENYDGSSSDARRQGYLAAVAAIRSVEKVGQEHIVLVQGIGGWARLMDYWVSNPMPGSNIAYEVHAYDDVTKFDKRFVNPSLTLPIVIGEFGPAGTYMALSDCVSLITRANELGITWLGWAFHPASSPSMLVKQGSSNCGVGMDLSQHTEWGKVLVSGLLS